MIISNAAIRNRTTVGVIIAAIVIAGTYSYVTLPRESSPDVPVPYIFITTVYEGVSPEDVESAVTIKMEKELAGLKGLKEMTSASLEGLSSIVLEFLPSVETDTALQRVRDKIDIARGEMPQEIEEPVITEISFADFPVIIATLSGTISPVRLKVIADDLEEVIESIPGVLNCDVLGALEREIRLEVDQDMLAVYDLTVPEILNLVPAENINVSAGGLETPGTKFNVRVPAEFVEPGEVNDLVIATRGERSIYLTDVARVRDTFKDRESFARLDGVESITLAVTKRTGENIVAVAEAVKYVLDEARQRVPLGVDIAVTMDQSKDIHMMVKDLENNLLSGLILVTAVLLVALGLRPALIVAAAIPLSMLLSVTVLQVLGYTLNMVVLFGLIMALGMLVDNAIVIVENIYRHYTLTGRRLQAAMEGTAEVAWPVITSTATTVAAFFPLIFWPGIMGGFMKYLPITLIITLTSSLFVAMVISPTMGAMFVKARSAPGTTREALFVRAYRWFLERTIAHRFTTLALAVLLLVGLGMLYVKMGHGTELFPDFDPHRGNLNIRFPQGTNIHEVDRVVRQIEQRLEPYLQRGEIEHYISNVGSGGGGDPLSGGGGTGSHLGNITLTFPDFEDRRIPSAQIIALVRDALTDIAGAELKIEKQEEGPPTGDAVTVRLIGEDFKKLEALSDEAKKLIADVPGLVNLRSDHEAARPELAFRVDRQRAMLLGLNTAIIGNFLKTAVFGSKVGTYRQFNDEYDITVRLPQSQRENIDDLFRLRIPSPSGEAIPLSTLGDFEYTGGMGTIRRVDQKRVVTLTASAEGRLDNEVLADVQSRLNPLGATRLTLADFSDLHDFSRLLATASTAEGDSPARRLWQRLDRSDWPVFGALVQKPVRPLIRKIGGAAASEIDEAEAQTLVAGLDRLLGDRDLYSAADFAEVVLPAEAEQLLGRGLQNLSEPEVRRFNRVLIEAAFPAHVQARSRLELPPGYEIRYAGKNEEEQKATDFLGKAFVAALLLIVLILVAQFNTLTVPVLIMTTVILSLIGVFAGLLICQMPFGIIMTGVGVISLAGVVVNNAIVLLDYTRLLQSRGMGLIEATVQAGATRLRPVLLTAITTLLGLVPMAIGVSIDFRELALSTRSESSQWWASMAIAVIFGLAFATILTLVVLPTLYVTISRMRQWLGLRDDTQVEVDLPEGAPAPTAA